MSRMPPDPYGAAIVTHRPHSLEQHLTETGPATTVHEETKRLNQEPKLMNERPVGPMELTIRTVDNGFTLTDHVGLRPTVHVASTVKDLVALIVKIYGVSKSEIKPRLTGTCGKCGAIGIGGQEISVLDYGRDQKCAPGYGCNKRGPSAEIPV